jgi:hypothetical protein
MVMFSISPLVYALAATLGFHLLPLTVLAGASGVAFFLGS